MGSLVHDNLVQFVLGQLGMVAHHFEDLIAWQLARRLQLQVFEYTDKSPASRDVKYCDQIRDSSRSATRNTAEGFGRYYPKEFGRFLRIAAGSLHETKNHLHDGLDRKYLSTEKHEELVRLTLRALKANVRLQAYLQHATAPEPFSSSKPPDNERSGLERSPEVTHREPREPAEPREPGEPTEPREPREPSEPREPREPREPGEPI